MIGRSIPHGVEPTWLATVAGREVGWVVLSWVVPSLPDGVWVSSPVWPLSPEVLASLLCESPAVPVPEPEPPVADEDFFLFPLELVPELPLVPPPVLSLAHSL